MASMTSSHSRAHLCSRSAHRRDRAEKLHSMRTRAVARSELLASAVACLNTHTHRGEVLVAQGDRGRVTAWRPAIEGAKLDSNPSATHPQPSFPPLLPLVLPLSYFLLTLLPSSHALVHSCMLRRQCSGLLRARSGRLRISMVQL